MAVVAVAVLGAVKVNAASFDQYVWQKSKATQISSAALQKYVPILNQEINAIVTKGALAPLVMHYSDQPGEGYAIYHERGRIITTLAMAYPYVSTALQTQIQTYVKSMLAGAEAFWSSTFKGNSEGVPRRLSGYAESMSDTQLFKNISTLYVIYGLWLYGDNTGDWATIQNYWSQIKTFYQNNKSNNILYGSLSGFIGMERLAHQFGDSTTETSVLNDLNSQFNTALSPSSIETRQKATSYSYFYDSRKASFFNGQPWMYLNMSPEVVRFVGDNAAIKTDYLNRLQQFQSFYSPWWLYQLPISTRWTGDEVIGTTPELMGFSFPAERWIKGTPASTLDNYVRSIPTGIGDSFWIESFISNIEANGINCWVDIRTGAQTCNGTVTSSSTSSSSSSASLACKSDINNDKIVDITDYSYLVGDFFKSTPIYPKSDIDGNGFVDLSDYGLLTKSFFLTCSN